MSNFKTHGVKKMKASASAASDSSESNYEADNSYCIFLHVIEGIKFHLRELRDYDAQGSYRGARERVIMNAALNGIQFEVEGTSTVAAETTIFNSNCVWEVDLQGLKQLKTDNRPVKLIFYIIGPTVERKVIGNLLLPLRGLPIISSAHTANIKMFWHKLSCLGNEWRSQKPEIYLTLALVKKSLLSSSEFEHLMGMTKKSSRSNALQTPDRSLTASMLQSQANIYVQQLVQMGLLQVGNDPSVDCDIIEVVLYLKELKNINKLIKSVSGRETTPLPLIIVIDFVGNVTTIDMAINERDIYLLSEKLGLRFKTSLKSLRLYFQRIFFLPINIFYNGNAVANYRMDFGKLLPDDNYFNNAKSYNREAAFTFDRFSRNISCREIKPTIDYKFAVELQAINSKKDADHTKLLLQYEMNTNESSLSAKAVGNVSRPTSACASARSASALNVTAQKSQRDTPRPYVQNLSTLNMQHVEELETNAKVAAWCEEVIKTHQQMAQSQQVNQTVRERALSWPPKAVDEMNCEKEAAAKIEAHELEAADCAANELQKNEACLPATECSSEHVIEPPHEFLVARRSEIAINTEPVTIINDAEMDNYHFNVVHELETWKSHEMEQFQLELKRKEMLHLRNIEKQGLVERSMDRTELSANISKCVEFEQKLEDIRNTIKETTQEKKTQTEHAQHLEKANREMKADYQRRFEDLECHITRLKNEMEQQLQKFQARHIELQEENMQLVHEKMELRERLGVMETQLTHVKQQGGADADDLRKLLNELCVQNERYVQMEKAKEFYKSQWRRCAQRMHKLKLTLLEKKECDLHAKSNLDVNFNIRDVIAGNPEPAEDDDDDESIEFKSKQKRRGRTKASYSGATTSTTMSETSSMDFVPSLSNETFTDSSEELHRSNLL